MELNYPNSLSYKIVISALMLIGIITIVTGLFLNPDKTWANYLLNNYYFLSVTVGATFFLALQYITQSGWSALFLRIPSAISIYFLVALILLLFIFFGMKHLYSWSLPGSTEYDTMIEHKAPYLNKPFFFLRMVIFFGFWIIMTILLRKTSLKEDESGGIKYFRKSELYSRIYIFILAITFSLATFDLIMSIDVHWFSTIFAVKNFVSGFYHSIAVITFIVILLNRRGYFRYLNEYHLRDFSRYIFRLCILWAYLWFVQYLLIWFTNIPEETIYYFVRTSGEWKKYFYLNLVINFVIPFIVLLPAKTNRNKPVLLSICMILFVGQWLDLFLQIMPGTSGESDIGFIEIGTFAGFAGLFIFIVNNALRAIPLIPKNHPYLQESIYHSEY